MKGLSGLASVALRVCGFLFIVGLLLSQAACSNQESDIAQLVRTVKVSKPSMQTAWRPDGKRFLADGFGSLAVWDAATGQQIPTPPMWVDTQSVLYSPDGRLLVLCKLLREGQQTITSVIVLDAEDHHVIREIVGMCPIENGKAFSSDSRLLVVRDLKKDTRMATVLDIAEKKPIAQLVAAIPEGRGGERIERIILSPDGSMVIAGCISGALNVWSTKDWQLIKTFKAHKGWILSMAVSPDGKWLATGSESGGVGGHYDPATRITTEIKYDDPIKIWSTTTWEQVKALPIRDKPTSSLAFMPDGKHLVSANSDRILFWDVQAEKQVGVIKGGFKNGGGLNFALSQDGEYLAVGGIGTFSSAEVQIWQIVGQLNNSFEER
ncbi:MAG: hypothetical protein NTY60_00080 [Proteobacteria bacterium]|nr:hypothetical protein [Pseudomonadota bacterium]